MTNEGPRFVRFFGPVLAALKELGDSGRPSEIYPIVARISAISEEELNETTKNGQSRFENWVGWARFYLVKAGYIDSSKWGVWALTDLGRQTVLSEQDSLEVFFEVRNKFKADKDQDSNDSIETEPSEEATEDSNAPDEREFFNEEEVRQALATHFKEMSPDGFERYCAYLLRVFGLQNVKVTGKVGDQGIDGQGDLMINRFVRSKVMFQCKRYSGSVGPNEIRDFRGAIMGRAERGVFLTTGTFTSSAKREGSRENTIPIELIELDDLIDLAIEQQVGVNEVRALEVDGAFFGRYKDGSS